MWVGARTVSGLRGPQLNKFQQVTWEPRLLREQSGRETDRQTEMKTLPSNKSTVTKYPAE